MKTKSSKKYYDLNPASKAVKDAYNKEYNKKPSAVAGRVADNKANRKAGTYGNGDGLDYQSKGKEKGKMIPQSKNRGMKEKSRVRGYKMKTKNGRSV